MITLLIGGVIAMAFIGWAFVYIVGEKTLAIPTFLGNRKMAILEEGFNLYRWPFCKLITYSTEPREQKSFEFHSNTADDEVRVKVSYRFKLTTLNEMNDIMKEYKKLHFAEGTYLLTYDKMQKSIEEDAEKRIHEMFDEQLAKIPSQLSFSKNVSDALQTAVEYGLLHLIDTNKTIEDQIIEFVVGYKAEMEGVETKEAKPTIIKIPPKVSRFLSPKDKNRRGIRRIFLEDYGVELMVFAVAIEPSQESARVRAQVYRSAKLREAHKDEIEFTAGQIAKTAATAGLKPEDAKEVVLLERDKATKTYTEYGIRIQGLEHLSKETISDIGKIAEAVSPITREGMEKGKGKPKGKGGPKK